MFARTNTQALKGFAAIAIFVFHIVLAFNLSPMFNMWGGHFVALFLILSGYGLEESYRHNGLDGYWVKRFEKVVLPTAFLVCAYNYLFPYFPFAEGFAEGNPMHRCLDELLYVEPTFWFVFFILKCYAVYWIGTRFMGDRLRLLFFFVCALICLNTSAPCDHLEAEQSFSFFAGVLLSMQKQRLAEFSEGKRIVSIFLLLSVGVLFLCLKSFTPLHELKGSIAYNYLLCPFRLSVGLALIPLLTLLRVEKSALLRIAGKYSLEIYIAHIPFIGMIGDAKSTVLFIICSVIAFALLMLYRTFVEGKLNIEEALFVAVNTVFVAKYASRLSGNVALIATLSAIAFYYVLLRWAIPYIYKCIRKTSVISFRLLTAVCLLAVSGMLFVQYAVDPYAIQVDRWSALHFPIENLLSGIYPYTASTHLGGNASPFPVWQILHVPFYLLGNVGLSFFAAAGLFVWSCYKTHGKEKALVVCLLLCSSVAVWYEVAVRSDFITNFLFLTAIINVVIPRISQQWVEEQGVWMACAVGLLACTRLLVLIPLGLLLLPYFIRMNWRRQLLVSVLVLGVFALTFVPFAVWDWDEFFYFHNNPWALQTRQGHLSDFILFIPLALYLSMSHKSIAIRYYRNSALMLMAFVCITFVHNMYVSQNWALFSPTYDITYLSSVLPFCMLAYAEGR